MQDYISIGASPTNENCIQIGEENYAQKAKEECRRFINLIRDKLGEEPEGAILSIKSFQHDFGMYYEVVCFYDDNNDLAMDYAFRCEGEAPVKWDENKTVKYKRITNNQLQEILKKYVYPRLENKD